MDTTVIDQFGIPLQIQMALPQGVVNPLPNGSGVYLDRADVLSQFQSGVPVQFQSGIQDLFQQPVASPLRILSPAGILSGGCVQGVSLSAQANGVATLDGVYFYAVTAADSSGNGSYAPAAIAAISVSTGNQVTIAWSPNSQQPDSASIASYNVYPYGPEQVWALIASPPASQFSAGCAVADTGQPGAAEQPPPNPLVTWFDSALEAFFGYYQSNTLQLNVVA